MHWAIGDRCVVCTYGVNREGTVVYVGDSIIHVRLDDSPDLVRWFHRDSLKPL
jgi:hypothetical protein